MSIEIHDLDFRRAHSGFGLRVPALSIGEGERVFIRGTSGSGKSTFLNLLAGMLVPRSGSITLLGTDITRLGAHARDRFRARNIGIVFQQFNLIPYLDVETNIRLALHFGGGATRDAGNRIRTVVEALGLSAALLPRPAGKLSVGQQQRVAIARAIINSPGILIADEPTSALDFDAREDFMDLLLQVQAERRSTLVFVSHDRTLAAAFPRVLDMKDLNAAPELCADAA